MIGLLAFAAATIPLSIELFLPAVSHTGTGILTSFALGLAIGHLVLGQVSDRYGRRPVLILCLATFAVSALAGAISPPATAVMLRFVQGLASSGLLLISKAVPREQYNGSAATEKLSFISSISFSVMLVGPLIGSIILDAGGLFLVNLVVGSAGFAALIWAFFFCKETIREYRAVSFKNYIAVITNIESMLYSFGNAFLAAGTFAFISASSYLVIDIYDYDRRQFWLIYAICMSPLMIGAFLNGKISMRISAHDRVKIASFIIILSCSSLIFAGLFLSSGLAFIAATGFYTFACGMLYPNSQSAALSYIPGNLGVGAGLLGALAYLGSAATSWLLSLSDPGNAPFFTAACGLLGVSLLMLGGRRAVRPAF